MALPSRLKSAARSAFKGASILSPTGIGVLLSVGAHAALLAFGPQTNFSFAALNQAAQEAKAEETIVPVMQLSPAERSRLPSFAQPRSLSPSPTGLTNLPLPSGLPFLPKTSTFPRRQVPANPMPSATTKAPTTGNLGALRRTIPSTTPFRLNIPTTNVPAPSSRPPTVAVLPPGQPTPPTSSSTNSPEASRGGDLPTLSTGTNEPASNGISTAQALENTEAAGNANSAQNGAQNGQSIPNPFTNPPTDTEQAPTSESGVDIAVQPSETGESAQSESPLIASANVYDETNVSEEAAEQNLAKWLEGKENVIRATAEMQIEPELKACRAAPPVDGRLGVIVNPDGTREEPTVLKSTGYDMINRLALSTLDYQNFGSVEAPTHYEVEVKVIYEPENCVETVPDALAE
jgi:hypothetical protein